MHKNSQILTIVRALGGLLLLVWCAFIHAQPRLPLSMGAGMSAQRIMDPKGQWSIGEVAAFSMHRWTLLKGPLSEGYSRSAVWLRLDPPPNLTTASRLWLEAGPTYLDHVDVFQRAGDGWAVQKGGDMVPLSQRRVARPLVFQIDPRQPVWVRIATSSAMQFHATLHDDSSLYRAVMGQSSAMGSIAGATACLLTAILLTGWWLRSRPLAAFGVVGLITLLHALGTRGYAAEWIPEAYTIWGSHLVGVGAMLLAAGCAWVVREQLTRGTRWQRVDRMLVALALLDLACIAAIPLNAYDRVAWVAVVSPCLSGVAGLWLCTRNRSGRLAHIVILGYVVHAMSAVLIALAFMGVLVLPFHAGGIWALQMVFFGLGQVGVILYGVARNYQQGQDERARALLALQESERVLELRVAERTQALQESRQALGAVLEEERLMRVEQRQFFNMVSHEFRTPLAIVDSAATAQLSFPSQDLDEQKARAAQIRRACRRLTSLVDNCLISDRMDASGFRLLPGLIDMRALLTDATQLVQWSSKHRLHLFLDAAPEHWPCDGTLVRIAVSNLVDNAVKYAAPGDIFVAARRAESGMLEISVADSGPGMSLEACHKVFQLFERGGRADETRGFGLGLWVTQRIARLHGGDVALESELHRGTCFTLCLAPQPLSDTDRSSDALGFLRSVPAVVSSEGR